MGVGSSLPAPSFPLRREILAQGGSLLVSVCLVWVVLALPSAGPHIPVCPGCSCMLSAGMVALAGAAVVDHARSARRQSRWWRAYAEDTRGAHPFIPKDSPQM